MRSIELARACVNVWSFTGAVEVPFGLIPGSELQTESGIPALHV